jgi:hypothetical protein
MKVQSMKKAAAQLFTVLALLALVGCAPTPQSATPQPQSKPDRPDWAMTEPDDEDGMKHFVGVSAVYSTEQSARDNAFEKANERAVQFLGNFAKGKSLRMAKTFGLKADTINETIGGREFQKQIYGAVSRQLKAKKWHYEIKSDGYIYFVLTRVPISVLDDSLKNAHVNAEKDAIKRSKDAKTATAKKQALDEAEFHSQMSKDGFMD